MRNFGQTKCRWCRKWLPACRNGGCLSDETKSELVSYVAREGRTWRAKLRTEWANGSEVLRELRNTVGPRELSGVKTPDRFFRIKP